MSIDKPVDEYLDVGYFLKEKEQIEKIYNLALAISLNIDKTQYIIPMGYYREESSYLHCLCEQMNDAIRILYEMNTYTED